MRPKIIFPYCFLLFTAILMLSCKKKHQDTLLPDTLPGVNVKVMTYNIYSGRKKGIDAIAAVIKKADPDLVGLQEVETNSVDFNFDVLKRLSDLTGMKYYHFAKALDLAKGEYGNLILSKYPLTEEKTYRLDLAPGGPDSYLRSFGVVKTEIEGKSFYFATTHLDHIGDNTNRLYQVEQIHAYTQDLTRPIILCGDFNARPTETPIKNIKQWFTLGCLDGYCGFTATAPKPDGTIDYLMYAPSTAMTTKSYEVYYQAFAESDHFPVMATFIIH